MSRDHCLESFNLPSVFILLVAEVMKLHDGVIQVSVESRYESHLRRIAWSQGFISQWNLAAHSSSTTTGKVTPHIVGEMVSLLIIPCGKSPSSSIISPCGEGSSGG
jgi:hypothetical protein